MAFLEDIDYWLRKKGKKKLRVLIEIPVEQCEQESFRLLIPELVELIRTQKIPTSYTLQPSLEDITKTVALDKLRMERMEEVCRRIQVTQIEYLFERHIEPHMPKIVENISRYGYDRRLPHLISEPSIPSLEELYGILKATEYKLTVEEEKVARERRKLRETKEGR